MQNSNNDLQLASMKSRALAFVIDDLLVTFIVIAMFWDTIIAAASASPESMMYTINAQIVTPLIFLKFIYQTVFIWYYGATVGKIIMKIRVIDYNNWGRVSIFSAILRSMGRIFSEIFFYVGFLIGFFNDGKRTFHDITGKTLVVNA